MDKVKILEIWKQDALENRFICEHCENSVKTDLSHDKFFCMKNNVFMLPDYSCLDFEFKSPRVERIEL